jgi:hypothetical protein
MEAGGAEGYVQVPPTSVAIGESVDLARGIYNRVFGRVPEKHTQMKLKMGIALIVSLAIELVNWFVFPFPIDVGYPPDTPWYWQLIGFQWVGLHYIGLYSSDWFEKILGCHQRNGRDVVMGCKRVDIVVFFTGGYLTTLLIVLAVMFGFQQVLRLRRRLSHQKP